MSRSNLNVESARTEWCWRAAVVAFAIAGSLGFARTSEATSVTFESQFLSSSSGSSSIEVGDVISFEQFVTVDAGIPVINIIGTFTGDIHGTLNSPVIGCPSDGPCFPDTAHQISAWEFAGSSASDPADLSLTRSYGPKDEFWFTHPPRAELGLGNPVFIGFAGLFRNNATTGYVGSGVRSLMGTVTVQATELGQFNAGMLLQPGLSVPMGSGYDPSTGDGEYELFELGSSSLGGSFTVHAPEPGTGLLLALGVVGLAAVRRQPRS